MKKFISILLAILVLFSMIACNQGADPNKTYLYIGNYDGATGHRWLEYYISEYQKLHPDVVISAINKKEEFSGDVIITNMPNDIYDLYFLDHGDYTKMIKADVLEDLTDIVTEQVYDEDGDLIGQAVGTKSIESFMYDEMKDLYNVGTEEDPQYYAIPYFYAVSGFIYDADLFENNKLYFDKDGEIGVTSTNPNIGPGPDGDYTTTYDNGEPETWEQFKVLLSTIKEKGLTAFTWSGTYDYPKQYALDTLYANYEGKSNAMLLYTLEGTDSNLGKITTETGYKLIDQPGLLAIAQAGKDIVSNSKYYTANSFYKGTETHTKAQETFAYSINTNQKIAMFMESSYWENESKGVFDDMEMINKDWGYGKRNFKLMSAPRFIGTAGISDQTNTRTTFYADGGAKFIAVKKNTKKLALIKDFLQFIHTRENMAQYTILSNSFRPFNYTLNEDELNSCTKFMRDIFERISSPTVDVLISADYNSFLTDNVGVLQYYTKKSRVNNQTYYVPLTAFHDNPTATAKDYIDGIKYYINASTWPTV